LRIRDIQDHGVAIVLRVLVQHFHHLLPDPVEDVVLLRLEITLGVFQGTLQRLLLRLDTLDQVRPGLVVELVALGIELLLQSFDFVVHVLEFGLFRLKLFLQ
jgi:hypothetical protein